MGAIGQLERNTKILCLCRYKRICTHPKVENEIKSLKVLYGGEVFEKSNLHWIPQIFLDLGQDMIQKHKIASAILS